MLIVDTQPPTTILSERNLYDREGMLDMSDRNGCHGALVGGNTTPVLSPPSSPECLKDYEDDDDSLILYYQQREDDDDDMTAECSFNRGKDQDKVIYSCLCGINIPHAYTPLIDTGPIMIYFIGTILPPETI